MAEKVLFVDDEPPVLEGYQRLLRRDFAVNTAVGGYQGLATIQANGPFAVVISDMRMPEMNGVEFLVQVRQKAPDSVRMLLTGHADLYAAIDAVNRGNIFRFLTKPCKKESLVDAIQSGLAQYRAAGTQRELARKAEAIERARSGWSAPEAVESDRVTVSAGLPGQLEARAYLQSHLAADRQCYVLMLRLSMLHTVEERYGESAAADYLMAGVQFLAQGLHADDHLYQWSGDVLMAVLERHVSTGAVRMEMSRLLLDTPQHLVEQNGRKTMVAMAISFDLLPAAAFSTMDEMLAAFDAKLLEAV